MQDSGGGQREEFFNFPGQVKQKEEEKLSLAAHWLESMTKENVGAG